MSRAVTSSRPPVASATYADLAPFKQALHDVCEAHPLLESRNSIDAAGQTLAFASSKPSPDPTDFSDIPPAVIQLLATRDDARFAVFDGSQASALTVSYPWIERAIAEAALGDLRVRVTRAPLMPGDAWRGELFRLGHTAVSLPADALRARLGFEAVGTLSRSFGASSKEILNGVDDAFADLLARMGYVIHRGMEWRCTDGVIRAEFAAAIGRWTLTILRDGDSMPQVAGVRAGDDFTPTPTSEPMVYARSLSKTIDEALAAAQARCDDMDRWTGGPEGGNLNLRRTFAAPFLRATPECAIVLQGIGGGGKSTLASDYCDHLGPGQSCIFSFDALTAAYSMGAENALWPLTNHLVALTDDYDPSKGRFAKALPALKSLLTGIFPFAPRSQGENAILDARPIATHIVTTNFALGLGSSAAVRRRFAMVVIRSRIRPELDAIAADPDGWATMTLASALTWVQHQDDPHETPSYIQAGVVCEMESEDVSDDVAAVIRQIQEQGYVLPGDFRELRGRWRDIGAVRRTRTVDGRRGVKVYTAPAPTDPEWGTWAANARALALIPADPAASDAAAEAVLDAAPSADGTRPSTPAPAPTDPLASSLTDVAAILDRAVKATEGEARHE